MIKLLLSLIIIILVLVYFWKYVLLTEPKKVKFHKKVKEINAEDNITEGFIKEDYETGPSSAQPNNVNKNIEKLEKIYEQTNPYNFYVNNYNTPNFDTNVLDLRKFYAYDLPPDSPEKSKKIPEYPFDSTDPNPKYLTNEMIELDKKYDRPWLYQEGVPLKSGLEYESDYWVYKNEIPMNGGKIGSWVGYENMGSSFSQFYAKDTADIVIEQEAYLKKDDDLRNGMGTTQKQEYLYDMKRP